MMSTAMSTFTAKMRARRDARAFERTVRHASPAVREELLAAARYYHR
jgi:hypothetical protein